MLRDNPSRQPDRLASADRPAADPAVSDEYGGSEGGRFLSSRSLVPYAYSSMSSCTGWMTVGTTEVCSRGVVCRIEIP